jgi:inorganic pyrophosphatase
MALVECYPIGVITMIDNGMPDDKIISIPFNDPTYSTYKDISQLPKHVFDEMKHFFAVYKTLENKETAIDEVKGVLDAVSIIEEAIQAYKDLFKK